jgi:hypothetical protein
MAERSLNTPSWYSQLRETVYKILKSDDNNYSAADRKCTSILTRSVFFYLFYIQRDKPISDAEIGEFLKTEPAYARRDCEDFQFTDLYSLHAVAVCGNRHPFDLTKTQLEAWSMPWRNPTAEAKLVIGTGTPPEPSSDAADAFSFFSLLHKDKTMNNKPITTITYVYGRDINSMTDNDIYDVLTKLEADITRFESLKARPKSIETKLAELRASVEDIVAAFDARVPA